MLILAGQYNTSELLVLFSRFIFVSILLGWSFIAFAFVISVSCAEKSKAAGLALLLWFVAVLLFDLVLLGLLVADVTWLTEQQLGLLLLFNPTDIFRLVNLMGLEQSAVGGVLNLAEGTNYSINQLVLVMVIWVLIPLFLAHRRFRRF